jgi:hypothetical protein
MLFGAKRGEGKTYTSRQMVVELRSRTLQVHVGLHDDDAGDTIVLRRTCWTWDSWSGRTMRGLASDQ